MEVNKDILEKAKKGDLDSFEQIVFLFEKPIFNYIFRLLGNRQDGEDVAQQTFIKLFKNIKNIDTNKNFSTYLYTIATNTAYDLLRKRKYVVEVGLEVAVNEVDETEIGEDPYLKVDRQLNAEEIQKHLNKLNPSLKTLILLFYYKQLSLGEISELLKMPIGTVKTNLFRARKKLKEQLLTFMP